MIEMDKKEKTKTTIDYHKFFCEVMKKGVFNKILSNGISCAEELTNLTLNIDYGVWRFKVGGETIDAVIVERNVPKFGGHL